MEHAFDLEVKEMVIQEKGLEFYAKWLVEDKETHLKIVLIVSYNMGWNKRSSGHIYNSLSSHAFIIGVFTRQIIDCIVLSKKYNICTKRIKTMAETEGCDR